MNRPNAHTHPGISLLAHFHPLAYADPDVTIGDQTRVWQFASINRGAKIGARCNIGACAQIDGSVIGDDTKVCYGVNMGPGFKIGNNVFLGPEVVLCNDRWPRTAHAGFDTARFDGDNWAVIIEDGASLGVRVTVLPGVRIGRNAMIGAHTVVARDVPDNYMMVKDFMVPIADDEAMLKKRMRFARDNSDPPYELTREHEGILQSAGLTDAEIKQS